MNSARTWPSARSRSRTSSSPRRRADLYAGRTFWAPAAARASISPAPTFHDLRHTSAALAIAEGAHPKAIQARLGHASITTTLNVYGHLFPSLDVALAERLDDVRADALAARVRRARPGEQVVVELPRR